MIQAVIGAKVVYILVYSFSTMDHQVQFFDIGKKLSVIEYGILSILYIVIGVLMLNRLKISFA